MFKRFLIYSAIFLGFIVLSVFYNYSKAQQAIKNEKPSILVTDLVSYPEELSSGGTGTFFWNVDTPNDLVASNTTLYWDYESSPSALINTDSPEAVGYHYKTTDYLEGQFKLPDTFDSQVTFDKQGTIYFRSYAKVNNLHLWSKEYSLTVK